MAENYWTKRERENIKREQMKDEEILEQMRDIIEHALQECEKQINDFYARYAGKNNMTITEAKKRVSEMDVKAFEKTAARYVREKDFSEKANKELNTYNTKMKINRQELLKMQLNAHLVAMADEQVKTMQSYLEQAGASEVLRQAGILGANLIISQETLQSIVGASFHSATWSSRIWGDMEELRKELNTVVNSSVIRGVHPDRYVKQIREKFDVSTYEARRLLITETARVQVEAQKLSYQKLMGDDPNAEYEYVAKLDDRTSKTCRGLDGHKFKVSHMAPGVNAPPMHPFCRSSTRLKLGDWRKEFFKGKKYTI